MADLQKSDAVWYRFWTRFLFVLALFRSLDFIARRFGDEKRTLFDVNDPRGNMGAGGLQLTGVVIGLNTTEDGKIIIRVTGGANPRTVSLYKATGAGGGDLIAQGTANLGATATLAEQNSSGVSGTYAIDASFVADTDDLHYAFVQQDWRLAATNRFDGSDDDGEDERSLQSVQNTLDEIQSLLLDARARCVTLLARIMVSDESNSRAWGSKFLRDVFSSLLSETGSVDGSGRVSQVRTGALPALLQDSIDESTGSTQTALRRLVAATAAVPDVNNDGQGSIGSHTPEAQMPTGRIVIRCTAGKEQGLPTAAQREQFSVSFSSDVDDRTKVYGQPLTAGAAYKGEDGFGGAQGATLERTLTKTGDNSHNQVADVASGFSVSGETLLNTDNGILYGKVVQDGADFGLEFYSGSSRDAASLVASSAAVGAGDPFEAHAANGSGLEFSGDMGAAPVDAATFTIDLNFFSTQNATGRPDEFVIDVSLSSEGEISRLLARMPILRGNGFRANGAASGELISDNLVKANTYVDLVGE